MFFAVSWRLRTGPGSAAGAVAEAVFAVLLLMAMQAGALADDPARSLCRAGPALADITFTVDVKDKEAIRAGGATSPYIELGDPKESLANLRDTEALVLPCREVIVVVDYPLKREFEFPLSADRPEGFTRAGIAAGIAALYQRIYAEEEASTTTPVVPKDQRQGLINRNGTNGKYGIWGHDLGDLGLSRISPQLRGGAVYLHLEIDS